MTRFSQKFRYGAALRKVRVDDLKNNGIRRFVAAFSIFPFIFGVYFYTLCPTVYWDDAGELIAACYTLGIPHPPGHPLYAILGKLFTLIPLGSPAFRVNLMSAFFGALTCVVLFQIVRELIEREERLKRFAIFGGMVSTFSAAFSLIMWDQSVLAETTTLHTFFMAIVTMLVFRIDAAGPVDARLTRRLLLFAFVYGLSFTNHVAGLFFAPSLAFILFYKLRLNAFRPGRLAAMILLFALGLSVYAYLPIASRFEPAVDWGNPETLHNFLWVVTARQYSTNLTRFPTLIILWEGLRNVLGTFVSNLNLIGCGFAIAGMIKLWRMRKPVVIYGLLVILILFLVSLNKAFISVYLLPAVLMLSIWIGPAIASLCSMAERVALGQTGFVSRFLPVSARGMAVILPLALLLMHFPECNKRHYFYAKEYGTSMLSSLPENAVLITGSADPLFICWYLQYCENYRTDVKIISRNAMFRPGYLKQIRRQYPDLIIPKGFQYESDEGIRPEYLNERGEGLPWYVNSFFKAFYDLNSHDVPIFWEGVESNQLLIERFIPHYLVFRILPPEQRTPIETSYIPDAVEIKRHIGGDLVAGKLYANHIFTYAVYYQLHNDMVTAERFYRDSLKLNPYDSRALNNIGAILAQRGNDKEAFERFLLAFRLNPSDATSNHNLGQVLLDQGKARKAIPYFRRAIADDPGNFEDYHSLGGCYAETGRNRRAIEMFEQALQIKPDSPETLSCLGVVYLRLKETENARKFLKTALELDPENAENWYNMACLQALENDISGASNSLKKALSLNYIKIYDLASKDPRMSPLLNSLSESK